MQCSLTIVINFPGIDSQLDLFTLKPSINHCGSDAIRKCTQFLCLFLRRWGYPMTGHGRYDMMHSITPMQRAVLRASSDISMENLDSVYFLARKQSKDTRHKMQMSCRCAALAADARCYQLETERNPRAWHKMGAQKVNWHPTNSPGGLARSAASAAMGATSLQRATVHMAKPHRLIQ